MEAHLRPAWTAALFINLKERKRNMDLVEFQNQAEQGRRIVSEMSDKTAFNDNEEVKAITCFATWQGFTGALPREVQIQAVRMSIEAAFRLGQLRA